MSSGIDSIHIHFNSDQLWLLNLCLAIIMLGVALDLSLSDFRRIFFQPKATLVGIFSQFIVLPALTFVLILIIQPRPSFALGMILVAACPGGNISNFMTHYAKGNSALSITLTAFSSLMAIFMTPVNLSFWGSLYGPTSSILQEVSLDPGTLFKTISVILGLPLVMGILVNHFFHDKALKLSKALKPISMLIFLGFVIVAFSSNFQLFLDYIHLVVLIVFVHNLIGLGAGFYLARWSGLSLVDQKSLSIETGIQNSGLGLILIFAFFDGLGGMAFIAAWWGIWHIISGLALAFFWGSRGQQKPQTI